MATYIFAYRVARRPLSEVRAELDEAALAARFDAWNTWFEGLGDHVMERGEPVNDARTIGTVATDSRIGGYSVISAASFDEAEALARRCPGVAWGGGVEIGELVDVGRPAAAATADLP